MYRAIDYVCNNEDCSLKGIKEERFVDIKDQDNEYCSKCGEKVSKCFGAVGVKPSGNERNKI